VAQIHIMTYMQTAAADLDSAGCHINSARYVGWAGTIEFT